VNDQIHDRRWWVLSVLILSLAGVTSDNGIVNVALPTIAQALSASQSQLVWIVDLYVLPFACLLFTAGVLTDACGSRRMLVGALIVFGVGSLAGAVAPSAGPLIAARALMGIGAAAIVPSTLSIISSVFGAAERGRAIGIWAGFSGLGIVAGPFAGGALLAHFWWGSVFLINVPIVAVAVVAALMIIPESRARRGSRMDTPGVLLSVAGLGALMFGVIRAGSDSSLTGAAALGPMLAGVALLAAFTVVEARSDHPGFDTTLFRDRSFTAGCLAITAVMFAFFGASFFLIFYLQVVRGYSPFQAALRLLPVAAAIVVLAPRSAALVHRLGAKPVITAGLLLAALAFTGFQSVTASSSIWLVELLLIVAGVGMASTIAPATTAILSTLPQEKAGAGAAVNTITRQVGGVLGVAILSGVLSAAYRTNAGAAVELLPAGTRGAAGGSIGATLATAQATGGSALVTQVRPAANAAFLAAMHLASLGAALIVAAGAVIVALWMPGRTSAGIDRALTGAPPT